MFKIGEFSKLTRVSIRMLRYYDEIGLLKPARIDTFSKYRLYSAEQIPIINRIVFLRDIGFNISEIMAALIEWDKNNLLTIFEKKRLAVMEAIQAEKEKLYKIDRAKKDSQDKKINLHYNTSIKSIPAYQVFSLRRIIPNYYAESQLWYEMSNYTDKNQIPISNETFTIYHDAEYRDKDVDVEICALINQTRDSMDGFSYRQTESVSMMACTLVYGPFNRIAEAYHAFAGWLQGHDLYEMDGTNRQIVHRGPWNETEPSHYLTEIQIPLKKKPLKIS